MFQRLTIVFIIFLGTICLLSAQSGAYFQQQTDYEIDVRLDDTKHLLTGKIAIKYTNYAPQPLEEIKMHLWANAFSSKKSAFTKQKLRGQSAKFYFADEEDMGGYSGLDFQVNGTSAKWSFDPGQVEIATIKLAQPLQPGASITITTPIVLKIPASFSRLGHVGTSYQMTQWYPKPAVYDQNGWHAMPNLDAGEFYSEFGSFRVKITLPENYVVGATGSLETKTEQEWLLQCVAKTKKVLADSINEQALDYPASSANMKTIEYTANRVHDFAWFADKRFHVLTDTATLSNGKRIPTWAMFTNQNAGIWKQGAAYVKRAIEFYSAELGDYPYEQASAVQSALSAGAGMEYPMITVIGETARPKSLDEVIAHEVGHNWFYGILASNERDHPWLDEGLNTFYEFKYMSKYYQGTELLDMNLPKFLKNQIHGNLLTHGIRFFQTNNGAVPPDTHSDESSEMQYGLMSYVKPAQLTRWLEESMGAAAFKAMMQDYYQKWQFKHPQPADFQAVVLSHNPKAQWYFDQMFTRTTTNYAITGTKRVTGGVEVTVKNKSDVQSPLPISALEDGHVTSTKWIDGFKGTQKVFLPCPEADAVMIDPDDLSIDLHRGDNYRAVGKPRLPGATLFALAPDPKAARVGITPIAVWNNYDKTQVGAAIYSPIFPGRKLSFMAAPTYSFASKSMTGAGELRYRHLPKAGKIQYLEFGLFGRTYHNDYNWNTAQYLRFTKFAPAVTMHIPNKSGSQSSTFRLRGIFLTMEDPKFDSIGVLVGKETQKWPIYEATYTYKSKPLPNPFTSQIQLEQQTYSDPFGKDASYLKTTLTHQQSFFYGAGKKIKARFFTGYFLQNTARDKNSVHSELARGSLSLLPQGFSDYKHDGTFLGRSDAEGLFARQIEQVDGGFKVGHGASMASVIGFSNDFICSINLVADLPKKLPFNLPLRPYFDIGYTNDLSSLGDDRVFKDKLLYSGGLSLSLLKGGVEVYFPIFNSSNLRRQYRTVAAETAKSSSIKWEYLHWISWSINLQSLHPRKLMDDLSK